MSVGVCVTKLGLRAVVGSDNVVCIAAGRSWKELTETEKAPYDALAEEERRKYEVAMREYSQVSLLGKIS